MTDYILYILKYRNRTLNILYEIKHSLSFKEKAVKLDYFNWAVNALRLSSSVTTRLQTSFPNCWKSAS
ncbi:hypothetical protein SAMN02927897_01746 [Kosakonia sacchari]|uniref:Uncharacterized protein n=1 Tax=Kosakonia sacchari TaxID=1158459 RepID=A0A1G4Y0U2_9ENTR|nr:hypothetical protein SAMN02927897_01746 [Kosakonia sacchari]